MKITSDEARRIAELAHLDFDDPGLERMADEMTKILSYIDQLSEIEGSADESVGATPMREDVARP
ncbi:MAG TPA: aspartyl/glutamyl-tRNA amidotransferase subunit C, partial [Thermoanaerobaculia bacterium]